MRTGLKTLFRRVIWQWNHPSLLYPKAEALFSGKGTDELRIWARIRGVTSELNDRNIVYNLGALYTPPHRVAIKAYQKLLTSNPNHLGSWLDRPPNYATQQLEYEVIHKMINLYKGEKAHLSGYITSGGTEGNIYATWLGRAHLEQKYGRGEICLLRTSLTHYSVRKAAEVCGVESYLTPLDVHSWGMHIQGLVITVANLHRHGKRGFLLPLSIGYTATGTRDNILQITQLLASLDKKYKNASFFLWIDAALNGLIEPFISDFTPFSSPLVRAIITDFHKFGLVPYPAGIALYRRELQKLVAKPIDYLAETDTALLGSRPGAPAAAIWTMIELLGKSGYRKLVDTQLENKRFFMDKLLQTFPKTEILTHNDSLTCGVIFHNLENQRLPQKLEDKYWLHGGKIELLFYPENKREVRIYKFFFLPHLKTRIVNEFINDLGTIS